MKIVDLVKGQRVLLNYGEQNGDMATCRTYERFVQLRKNGASYKSWEAEVVSKPRGKDPKVVCLKVFGFGEDIGDVYAHQIMAAAVADQFGTMWVPIEHSKGQKDLEAQVEAMGF